MLTPMRCGSTLSTSTTSPPPAAEAATATAQPCLPIPSAGSSKWLPSGPVLQTLLLLLNGHGCASMIAAAAAAASASASACVFAVFNAGRLSPLSLPSPSALQLLPNLCEAAMYRPPNWPSSGVVSGLVSGVSPSHSAICADDAEPYDACGDCGTARCWRLPCSPLSRAMSCSRRRVLLQSVLARAVVVVAGP